jgi:MscS family membrane protein
MGLDKAYVNAIERGAASAGSLIRLSQAVLKVVILAAVAFTCLGLLGFQLTPALAGLGLSGVVLAFAAQKTLENVFAGVSLLSDETIRVGDFCVIGTQKGTVESIGLRSTTLRTLDRTLLSIPNGPLAAMTIENFAYRDKISFNPMINLRYETTAEQMRTVLAGFWRLIEEDPRLETDGSRARFVRLGPSSLDVEIYSYVLTRNWEEFNAIREELLLRIMEIVETAGTGFAFPSQTLYLSRDTPPKPQT